MGDFLPYSRNNEIFLDPLGTLLPILLLILIGMGVGRSRLAPRLKRLLYGALVLRAVGSLARFMILFGVYDGSGDAREYYRGGLVNAAALWGSQRPDLFNPSTWYNGHWYGTQFVYFPSTLVAAFTGPSMLGGFIVFSLLALAGLYAFIIAFQRAFPGVPVARYARWICFFPALWYWPSSIGKEAIVLLGMGLCTLGYVGRGSRINWLLLATGVFLVFGIRPQVAAVVILSVILGHWLALGTGRWTLGRILQALVLLGVGYAGISVAMETEGVESLNPEGMQSYIAGEGARYVEGGSAIEAVSPGLAGVPMALANILIRPFPWEAHNLMVLVACLEILGFWAIVWFRRRNFVAAIRHWRHNRLLRLAVPFIVIYAVSLGLVVANMGIIARQRIFLFPFLFLLVEGMPERVRKAAPLRWQDVSRTHRAQHRRHRELLAE